MGTIETNRKARERVYVVCFDDAKKFWEVCCWSSEVGHWVRPDGGVPQFSPSSWVACAGDGSGKTNPGILNVLSGAQPILTAPKSGAIIILLDDNSGAWEVGYWSAGIFNWTQMDGEPLRIFPTHWASANNCSIIVPEARASQGDNSRIDDNNKKRFLPLDTAAVFENRISPSEIRPSKLRRGVLAVVALIGLLPAGYALGIFGDFAERRRVIETSVDGGHKAPSDEASSIENRAVKLEAGGYLERARADSIASDPDQAAFAGPTTAEASPLDAAQLVKLVAAAETVSAGERDAEPKRSDGVAQELAIVRAELADRVAAEASARREVAQLARLLEVNEKIWAGALDAERERSDGIARELATVRAELADHVTAEAAARMEVAQLAAQLEANKKESTTRLNAERERLDNAALVSVRAQLEDRIAAEASARRELAQLAKRLEANEKEWTTRLNAERERSERSARDLATLRGEFANRISAEAAARMEVAQAANRLEATENEWTARLNAERERSEGIARDLATVREELARRIAVASAPIADDIKTGSTTTDRPTNATAPDPSKTTIGRAGKSMSAIGTSAVDEAKLVARAQFLIEQGDVAGARQFLERAVEGGSAQAAFLLAETYDWRILRALQVYGVRGDTKKALELYGLASRSGIDNAKERISALEGAETRK